MTTREYVYRVTDVEKITDGDTYWLRLDVGFRQSMLTHLRLAGYDTPEANRGSEAEKAAAKRATLLVWEFFNTPGAFWCRTEKDPDNFGRWLGEIWRESDQGETESLADFLVANDLAALWPARWRDVFDEGAE